MKAAMELVQNYRGTGVQAIVVVLRPENIAEKSLMMHIASNVPPEGNIVGWIEGTRILLETGPMETVPPATPAGIVPPGQAKKG